jgi:Zn-dependent membrane protease YugP
MISWGLIIAGMIFYITGLAQLGIIFFSVTVLFQLVTLPIEVNASKRALAIISDLGIVTEEENIGARQVLRAAAWTYIAGLSDRYFAAASPDCHLRQAALR